MIHKDGETVLYGETAILNFICLKSIQAGYTEHAISPGCSLFAKTKAISRKWKNNMIKKIATSEPLKYVILID